MHAGGTTARTVSPDPSLTIASLRAGSRQSDTFSIASTSPSTVPVGRASSYETVGLNRAFGPKLAIEPSDATTTAAKRMFLLVELFMKDGWRTSKSQAWGSWQTASIL